MAAPILVFGPTGNVASIAARTAVQHGAKVFLAMRDTTKMIPGLNAAEETSGRYERVQADLTQPETISKAVQQTNATTIFMYLAWNSTDHMKSTLEAAKAAGVTFIVFLSSFTIKGDLAKVPSDQTIPYRHAQVELNLESIYGSEHYFAIRAGAFATNTLSWSAALEAGELSLENPDAKRDYITPDDMGRLAGTALVKGQLEGQHIVYLYGPKLIAPKDALTIVANAVGKRVIRSEEEKSNVSNSLLVKYGTNVPPTGWFATAFTNYEENAGNFKKYTGLEPMSYQAWVDENVSRFKQT